MKNKNLSFNSRLSTETQLLSILSRRTEIAFQLSIVVDESRCTIVFDDSAMQAPKIGRGTSFEEAWHTLLELSGLEILIPDATFQCSAESV